VLFYNFVWKIKQSVGQLFKAAFLI